MPRTPEIPITIAMEVLKTIIFVTFKLKDSVNIIKEAMRAANMPMKSKRVIKRNLISNIRKLNNKKKKQQKIKTKRSVPELKCEIRIQI